MRFEALEALLLMAPLLLLLLLRVEEGWCLGLTSS